MIVPTTPAPRDWYCLACHKIGSTAPGIEAVALARALGDHARRSPGCPADAGRERVGSGGAASVEIYRDGEGGGEARS